MRYIGNTPKMPKFAKIRGRKGLLSNNLKTEARASKRYPAIGLITMRYYTTPTEERQKRIKTPFISQE